MQLVLCMSIFFLKYYYTLIELLYSKHQMNIKYIVPYLNDPGGIQQFSNNIYRKLANKHNIQLFNWQHNSNRIISANLKYSKKRFGSHIHKFIYNSFIASKYQELNNSIIHFWQIEPSINFTKEKYIITIHGLEILPYYLTETRKFLYQKALDNATFITFDSRYSETLLKDNFKISKNNTYIIHPPIDIERNLKLSKGRIKTNKQLTIGTISRFVQRKNIPTIIKALVNLKQIYKIDFVYYLAGDGPDKEKILESLKNVDIKWKYFGKISEKEKFEIFYPSLDVFVMTPLELRDSVEGFGIVYLEANSYGIPVVSSKTGGVVDAVKENFSGVYANPTNPEDISAKIVYLIKNKVKFYHTSKEWVTRFNSDRAANQFENLYKKMS